MKTFLSKRRTMCQICYELTKKTIPLSNYCHLAFYLIDVAQDFCCNINIFKRLGYAFLVLC